jgi:hypothetical protein
LVVWEAYFRGVPLVGAVRLGLLVIGVTIGIVGAGVIASMFFLPGPTSQTQLGSVTVPRLGPAESQTALIEGNNVSSGTLAVAWTSTSIVDVELYRTVPCGTPPGVCATGPAVARWNATESGRWSESGDLSFPVMFQVQDVGQVMITLQGTVVEMYSVGGLPTWAFLSFIAGGGVLIGIGALAVFFGLFLRGGIYTDRNPPDYDYPDDLDGAEEFADDADLDDIDDGPPIPPSGP